MQNVPVYLSFIRLVIGWLPYPSSYKGVWFKSSPSVCFLEHILCKKEGLGMLGRLVSRKEA